MEEDVIAIQRALLDRERGFEPAEISSCLIPTHARETLEQRDETDADRIAFLLSMRYPGACKTTLEARVRRLMRILREVDDMDVVGLMRKQAATLSQMRARGGGKIGVEGIPLAVDMEAHVRKARLERKGVEVMRRTHLQQLQQRLSPIMMPDSIPSQTAVTSPLDARGATPPPTPSPASPPSSPCSPSDLVEEHPAAADAPLLPDDPTEWEVATCLFQMHRPAKPRDIVLVNAGEREASVIPSEGGHDAARKRKCDAEDQVGTKRNRA